MINPGHYLIQEERNSMGDERLALYWVPPYWEGGERSQPEFRMVFYDMDQAQEYVADENGRWLRKR